MTADSSSPDALMPLVYEELRRIAAGYIRRERPGQTLQATALVNEAFVRLAAGKPRPFAKRTHFLDIAALSMRQILVQRARARHAEKRGGAGAERITLDESSASAQGASARQALEAEANAVDILELDAALDKLAATAKSVSEALSNVPQGFDVALARFNANRAGSGYVPSSGGGINFNGATVPIVANDPQTLYDQLTDYAFQKGARGGASPRRTGSPRRVRRRTRHRWSGASWRACW